MDLTKRVISAVVMIAIVVAAVILNGWYVFALASFVSVLMMLDVSSALKKGGYKVSVALLMIASAILIPATYFYETSGYIMVAGCAFTVASLIAILSSEPDFNGVFATGFALVYPMLPAHILVDLFALDIKGEMQANLGLMLVLGAVFCACFADMLAYFGGRLFGKKKLCPKISPKKTVAGSIFAFVGSIIGSILMYLLISNTTLFGANTVVFWKWIIVGFFCGGFSQIGDLVASMLKRHCNIKDYGKYIPGHGGIMDRMDSISLCLIVIVSVRTIFGF